MKQMTTLAAILAVSATLAMSSAARAEEKPAEETAGENKSATTEVAKPDLIEMANREEEKRKAAEKKEMQRLAAEEKKRERLAKQQAWAARCVIKPAMSDEEIAVCREVRTKPAP